MLTFNLLGVALVATYCNAQYDFIRGGNTCAGVHSSVTADPTRVVYGPCNADSTASMYIEQDLEGMAAICNVSTYLTDTSQVYVVDPLKVNNQYVYAINRKQETVETQPGCSYGANQASIVMGNDPNNIESGGVLQYANYISTGTGDCKTGFVDIPIPKTGGCGIIDECTDYSDGICIMKEQGNSCNGVMSFSPGTLKFSIGLYLMRNYAAGFVICGTWSHAGVRVKYGYATMGSGVQVTFNDADSLTLSNIKNQQVESVTFKTANGEKSVVLEFDAGYTYGAVVNDKPQKQGFKNDMLIRASRASGTAIYIDYIFPRAEIENAHDYVMYDPQVKTTGGVGAGSHVTASAIIVSALTMVMCVFAW